VAVIPGRDSTMRDSQELLPPCPNRRTAHPQIPNQRLDHLPAAAANAIPHDIGVGTASIRGTVSSRIVTGVVIGQLHNCDRIPRY
jgi:hypothetical protein